MKIFWRQFIKTVKNLKIYNPKALGFLLMLAFVSCDKETSLPDTPEQDRDQQERRGPDRDSVRSLIDSEEDPPKRSKSSCSETRSSTKELSLKDNKEDFITANNVSQYELSGRCEMANKAVTIQVNGYSISENPSCNKSRWKVQLDLSSIAQLEDRILFAISHNGHRICKELRVAFLGPKNYIPVPGLKGHYKNSFYVMKYEAKIANYGTSNAKAISQPEDKPFTKATYADAVRLCTNNGPGYYLMENSQWQNIVLFIEDNLANWSEGRKYISDTNQLNCGVTSGLPLEADSNDLNDCFGRSCDPDWDFNRRTHILSNGETIWDMCGNTGEMMRDKYAPTTRVFRGPIYQLPSFFKKSFGPAREYQFSNENRRSQNWGLGYADIQQAKNLIVRGSPGRNAGLFSVHITHNQDARAGGRGSGFRCVYIP